MKQKILDSLHKNVTLPMINKVMIYEKKLSTIQKFKIESLRLQQCLHFSKRCLWQ